jgi:hypothetical protein
MLNSEHLNRGPIRLRQNRNRKFAVFGYHFENQNQTRTFAVNRNITAVLLLKNRTSIILASLTFYGLPPDIYVADSALILCQEYTRSGHNSTPLHFLLFHMRNNKKC